ncbi:MAG: HTH-type transcriptional regulator TtgR [bacterium ADurb.Bin429]|nr:MAG: HTH-type transcriptional regulator TtgR [bacterium ADurb.Bin429]
MDTSGKRTRKTALARREEILAAAMRLFARQGYARTTTKEIAQEAGISEGTIYRYFSSKQEILFAFSVPAIITPLHELLDQMADADDLTVLRALILNRFKLWDEWRDVLRAVMSEAFFNAELVEAFYQHIARAGLNLLEAFITRGIAEGRFRPVRVAVVSRSLLGMMIAHFHLWNGVLGGQHTGISREELIDELAQLLYNALLRHSTLPEATL